LDTGKVAETFVELVDTLVDDFEVWDLLHLLTERCLELLAVDAAGVLLVSPAGRLRVAVSTSPSARALDVLQTEDEEGPSPECYSSASPVAVEDLDEMASRWPKFAQEATSEGFSWVAALPMRRRDQVIGVLNLLGAADTPPVSQRETQVAQAMADTATIAILQYRHTEELRVASEQLLHALESRVVIEQGKGVLETRLQVSEDEAFRLLRRRARDTRRRLTEVAEELRRLGPNTDWDDYRLSEPNAARHDDDGASAIDDRGPDDGAD